MPSIRERMAILARPGPPAPALDLSTPLRAERRTQAFTVLYRTQFDRVYAYLRYRTEDRALAEDLAAEVFVRAWDKLRHVDNPQAAAAWLFATARNLVVDYYRARSSTVPLERLKSDFHPSVGPPDDHVLTTERASSVQQALRELGEREREVIGLRFVAGLRNREIAAVIGTSEGNVAKIVHRTLRKLKERLSMEEGFDVSSTH